MSWLATGNRVDRAIALMEQVAGPITWEGQRARGTFGGRPIWFEILRHRYGAILSIEAPIGRPISYGIHLRRTYDGQRPELHTGDAAFDAMYLVEGTPAEVLARALDDKARRSLSQLFPNRDPNLDSWDGSLVKLQQDIPSEAQLRGGAMPFTPPDVAARIDLAIHLSARLLESFDAQHASIAQQHGPAAAQQWLAQQEGQLADLRRARDRSSIVILIAVLAVLFLVALAAVAIVVIVVM